MKSKLILFALLILMASFGHTGEEVRVIAKIKSVGDSQIQMTSQEQTTTQFIRFADPKLAKIIEELSAEDEVLLSGKVEQYTESLNDKLNIRTLFIIEDVRPISLKRLGKMEDMKIAERPMHFVLDKAQYAPNGFPVTKEVAASITITASLLMLRSLSATPQEPVGRAQMNEAVIFSAGALATGIFIWDQIKSNSLQKK